jgi:tight adherence protein B
MSTLIGAVAAKHAFWSSTAGTAVIVVLCAVIVAGTVLIVLSRRNRPESVTDRVRRFVGSSGSVDGAAEDAATPVAGTPARTGRSLERERLWDEFTERLEIARIERTPTEVVGLVLVGSLGAAALLALLTGSVLVGAAALVFGPLIAKGIINRQLQRQRLLFGEQLPAHLQELAAALRAGHSMVSGIAVMAEGASEPSRAEFQRVVADEQLGSPLENALASVAVRMAAPDIEQVSLVAELHRQTGGNMAEVLDRVAESLRARAELRRELLTLTAQARGSRWIVTLIPPALLIVIDILNPAYLRPLFSTSTGHILLIIAAGSIIAGSAVMSRIIRIEV